MPPFRATLLRAFLLIGFSAGLLAPGSMRSAQAQTTPATEKPASVGTSLALTGPEQRIALVIGNAKYQNTVQLANPGNDTRAVAQLLNSAGFEVISATDLNHNQMIEAVQEFSGRIAGRGPNTVAMVYYAGHGVQLAGENYLIPVDAKVSSEPDLVNGSLRLVDVMATLETIPSRVRIVILDACRNNPFPSLNDAGRGLAIVDAPKGSIVAYSTAPGTEALDGTGDHSPFTSAFLRLANEKNLPIEQLFKRIRLDVGNSTEGRQTPWESSSLTSDFYFFGDTAVAATRAPAQTKMAYAASDLPSRSSRQAYEYVVAENSIENYQEFIRIYPHDPMTDRIRILLGNLMQAKAWHTAVKTNSPVAYQSFYEKFSNGPYAQSALKMAAQPRIIPLSQPTRILAPASIKFGGFGPAKDNFGRNPGPHGLPQGGGKIVTLPSPGAKPGFGNSGAGTGKIINLPGNNVGKVGERPTSKLGGLTRVEKRTSHSSPRIGGHRGQAGIANTGSNQRFATSPQFRGSFGQARTGGFKTMR
ncbi:caspase family protein [Bradyrhizobium sp.]|uniref:caspase family protein n=1 Tax=Bradyrhizobium sp. TaxID=376 RepID=UPI002734B0F8|nr:caspase family protein [Bradyrhizobium sp.]MDP3691781.1 caspase family protein [Bradyrhizobium sp.]